MAEDKGGEIEGQVRYPTRRSGRSPEFRPGQAVGPGQAAIHQGFRRAGEALGTREAAHTGQAETFEPAENAGPTHVTE